MNIVEHGNLELTNCYIQELPRPSPNQTGVSEPVDYREVVFHVPIMTRGVLMDDIVDIAVRHYIEKRGHPGRDRLLKINVISSTTLGNMKGYIRLAD